MYAENTGATFNDALQAAAEGRVPMLNTRSEKAIASFSGKPPIHWWKTVDKA